MGTTYSLPEEVLTTKVAQYSFRISKELYALRATSKSGLALAQRGLSSSCSFCSAATTFGDGGETRQQRPRSPWLLSYSHHKRTHVYTLCAGALHGALALSV